LYVFDMSDDAFVGWAATETVRSSSHPHPRGGEVKPTIQLPFEQTQLLHAPPGLDALRADGPIHRVRTAVGDEAWLVTGYEELRRLFGDDRLGRAHPDPQHAARTGESVLFGGPMGDFESEAADHARTRQLLQPHFSAAQMRRLRPRVEAFSEALLDRMEAAGPPADLIDALALPLPVLVICELLGVPYQDRARFRAWTEQVADVRDRARSERGLAALFDYGQHLVAHKRAHPSDDVISALCATDGVGDDEIARLAMSLLFAGHETTVVAIGIGALALLASHHWQTLLTSPKLIPDAVEEMLRVQLTGGVGIPRYARADTVIGDVTVRPGDMVVFDIGAANHDPTVFADPGCFDPGRRGVPHLAFGHGARYCIGAPLARIELQTVFAQLVPRFPALDLAVPVEDLQVHDGQLAGGLAELPVTW
jgi:cytochrome P450